VYWLVSKTAFYQKVITISDMQELAKRKNGKRSTW
jgi:hypothetical protein